MHSFENRIISISEFSSCVTSGGRLGRAVSFLENDSAGDFRHSKQCKYKEKQILECSQEKTNLSSGKGELQMFSAISGRHVGVHLNGHQHGSINLCRTLCQITRVRNTAQTWGLDRILIYLSSIVCNFLDFIHRMVFDFYFDGVTVKTGNCAPTKSSYYS